jgi:hypothetical protein
MQPLVSTALYKGIVSRWNEEAWHRKWFRERAAEQAGAFLG